MPADSALLPCVLRLHVRNRTVGPPSALAAQVSITGGGAKELYDYLSFLKGGCSKDPLDLLRGAGVDMEQPEPPWMRGIKQRLGRWWRSWIPSSKPMV